MRNGPETEITRLLDIPYPIIHGPFGRGGSSPLLAATVSNAGGLGSFGAANDLAPEDITKVAAEIRRLTDKPFGMNLWVSTFDPGGDTLEQAAYGRVLALLAPYYEELGVKPPPVPIAKAPNFDHQVAACSKHARRFSVSSSAFLRLKFCGRAKQRESSRLARRPPSMKQWRWNRRVSIWSLRRDLRRAATDLFLETRRRIADRHFRARSTNRRQDPRASHCGGRRR